MNFLMWWHALIMLNLVMLKGIYNIPHECVMANIAMTYICVRKKYILRGSGHGYTFLKFGKLKSER